jgi:hypothetical protein
MGQAGIASKIFKPKSVFDNLPKNMGKISEESNSLCSLSSVLDMFGLGQGNSNTTMLNRSTKNPVQGSKKMSNAL